MPANENRRGLTVRTAIFSLMIFLVGCGRSHVKGTVAVDTVLKAWTADGFDTAGVLSTEPESWNAGACSKGAVAGLEVLLCEYTTDQDLASGEKKEIGDWEAASVPTGAIARTSRTLLAVADRAKADPNGRTIARLLKTFRELH